MADGCPVRLHEDRPFTKTEALDDRIEPRQVLGLLERGGTTLRVDAGPRLDLLYEPGVQTETAQAEYPRQPHPCLASVVRLVGQSPGNEYDCHSAADIAASRRRPKDSMSTSAISRRGSRRGSLSQVTGSPSTVHPTAKPASSARSAVARSHAP